VPLAVLILLAAVGPSAAVPSAATPPLLDVPYVAQREALCGGAAAAMVLRYWGERDVYAEDFAPLLNAEGTGIRGDVLIRALQDRGWTATSMQGTAEIAIDLVARGRPLIALLEEGAGRYHYLVIIGWHDGRVFVHDPARGPSMSIDEGTFTRQWRAAGSWTLLVTPGAAPNRADLLAHADTDDGAAGLKPRPTGDPCRAMVDEGVQRAANGQQNAAEEILSAALERCPASPRAARELAGRRFVQCRLQDAAGLGARAAAEDPADAHAWRLLGSAQFLRDRDEAALDAWNRVGEPRVDLVRVDGLEHTRYVIVEALLGVEPRLALTSNDLRLARRRITLLPSASHATVRYRPAEGGIADVQAAVVERPLLPGRIEFAGAAVHAATERELRMAGGMPGGVGARWSAAWRWWAARPRIAMTLDAPSAFGVPGLWQLDASWEAQSYASGDAATLMRDERRHVSLGYTNWLTADLRAEAGVLLDRWDTAGTYAGVFGAVERRFARDRVGARAEGALWPGAGKAPFRTGGVSLSWKSSAADWPLVSARAGAQTASREAPLDVWPGAGVGHARSVLARAHPLLDHGVIRGALFGRTLAHGGLEFQVPIVRRSLARFGIAAFGDVARAWHTLDPSGEGTQVDVGVGLRVRVAGYAPTLRLDVAHGLRDGRTAFSAGWQF
jgi:predicted double-glycine peptidase